MYMCVYIYIYISLSLSLYIYIYTAVRDEAAELVRLVQAVPSPQHEGERVGRLPAHGIACHIIAWYVIIHYMLLHHRIY